ncbi:MAG: hypothetical protein LBH00_02275 [Planctomycetaceae bacterium]|jgi:hypothetical protein|nr:hypothetical protein [Planctomycetaceae bacterium]
MTGKPFCSTAVEILCVFAVIALFGAWAVPDLNEAHYICKAVHFWNPDWIPNDAFLESKDSQRTFYFLFGWLPLLTGLTAAAWIGRITAWLLLAWSWQRLSFALIPVRWAAVPTVLAFAYYIENFHMAGEWMIGGIEGKSLAYPFVLFALESMVRRRWNRAGVFLGIASALHILVGGWASIIAGFIFLTHFIHDKRKRHKSSVKQRLRFPFIGVFIGGGLALFGLLPGLQLDAGVPAELVRQAHQIYVFERLPHHLVPYLFQDSLLLRFIFLTVIWIMLCRFRNNRYSTFNAFVFGTVMLSATGLTAAGLFSGNRELSAEILRFYWFRLSDVFVPIGVAAGAMRAVLTLRKNKMSALPKLSTVLFLVAVPLAAYAAADYFCFNYWNYAPNTDVPFAAAMIFCYVLLYCVRQPAAVCRFALGAAVFFLPLCSLPMLADLRTYSGHCRSEPAAVNGRRATEEWREMCGWVKEHTPKDAKFWVPRDGGTFKWHARRSDVCTWKNVPQDAASIAAWYSALRELYTYKAPDDTEMVDRLLTTLIVSKPDETIEEWQQRYGFDYVICAVTWVMPQPPRFQLIYANKAYCVYKIKRL